MPFNLSFRNFHNYTYPEHHGRLDTHKNVVRSDGDSFSICVHACERSSQATPCTLTRMHLGRVALT